MIKIVLLVGRGNSGKTRTLKKFFGIEFSIKLKRYEYIERVIDQKVVCSVGLSSPQELISFCNYKVVIENIKTRLEKAKREVKRRHNKKDFIFIIPFGLYMKIGKMNEDCIKNPIEQLKLDGYEVFPIYLKRKFKRILSRNQLFDNFIGIFTSHKILSREEYDKQAEEVKRLIN